MTNNEQALVICVFCGSQFGSNPAYVQAARDLAEAMHKAGAKLVYGGGTVGLMGEVARTLVKLSGASAVHGIIPSALVKYEQSGRGGTEPPSGNQKPDESVFGRTTIVPDMHTRKRMMADEVIAGRPGSGFVALPGGYGTMEELFEVTTWNQLGIHDRPICILNTDGFYEGLVQWVRRAVADNFIGESNKDIIAEAKEASQVLDLLANYQLAKGRFGLDWNAATPVEEKKEPAMS